MVVEVVVVVGVEVIAVVGGEIVVVVVAMVVDVVVVAFGACASRNVYAGVGVVAACVVPVFGVGTAEGAVVGVFRGGARW